MNVFKIDADWFSESIAAVIDLEASYDKNGQRRTSPDGIPQWTLTLAMRPENARAEIAQVNISSATEPKLVDGAVPVFGGLMGRYWQGRENRSMSGVMIIADSVGFDKAKTTTKRPEPSAA